MLLLSLYTTDARPDGPPVDTAASLRTDMRPMHPGGTPPAPPPYAIMTSATCYAPGQAITGTNHRLNSTFLLCVLHRI